tara:strand:- start:689 stop:940 length:252 start_codon:yes stop_codon:yes gene_type:complete
MAEFYFSSVFLGLETTTTSCNADFDRLHPYKTHLKNFESMVKLQLKMFFFIGNHSNGNSGKICMRVVYGNILIVNQKTFDYIL